MSFSKNTTISSFMAILLSFGMALVVLNGQAKIIAAMFFLSIIIVFWMNSTHIAKIALTVLTISFPVTLPFFGKDAMTTGTFLIIILFIHTLSISGRQKNPADDSGFVLKSMAILVTITPASYYGPAIRHLLIFISSILLFFVIIKSVYVAKDAVNTKEYIDKILSILILVVSLHIILSAIFYYFPNFQNYFKIFLTRTQSSFAPDLNRINELNRAATIFTGGEEMGELLAIMFPFFFYKAITEKKFFLLLPIFFLGLLISGTRSAAILVLFELIPLLYISRSPQYFKAKMKIFLFVVFFLVMAMPFINQASQLLLSRFEHALIDFQSKASPTVIMNRNIVWEGAWSTTRRTLSLIGHGPIQAYKLDMNDGFPNFHSLYLTLIFQFGIVGSIIFMFFFFMLFKRMFCRLKILNKDSPVYLLTGTCILSLTSFLINEVKFEFNRGDSYQQLIWIIFAVYFVVGSQIYQKTQGK
jgi:O-antigen ligase